MELRGIALGTVYLPYLDAYMWIKNERWQIRFEKGERW